MSNYKKQLYRKIYLHHEDEDKVKTVLEERKPIENCENGFLVERFSEVTGDRL
jgi:hypothetical protein